MTPPVPLRGSPPRGHILRSGEASPADVAGMARSAAVGAVGSQLLPALAPSCPHRRTA